MRGTEMISRTTILALAFATALPLARASNSSDEKPRFAATARLEPMPAVHEGGRFGLRAELIPRSNAASLEGAGFRLKASLQPTLAKSCPVPGAIFADGFEGP
jgi:hypothetical protein